MKTLCHRFEEVVSLENLALAWEEFSRGKRNKPDVQLFERNLIDNLVLLHNDLVNHTYKHSKYYAFFVNDPKQRRIHKAIVRDRVVHHAVHRILYPFFAGKFIADSFSCQIGKGTHKALIRFKNIAMQVSRNNTRTCWVLKCDIRKFFASIDHDILFSLLQHSIPDQNILWLLQEIISSFETTPVIGLPLGNLTSQLFANVYMHEFDLFTKKQIKAKYYIRYTDDFVIFSHDRNELLSLIEPISSFLFAHLRLSLHPEKLFLKTFSSGVDFLGWIHFPTHRVLRASSRHRILKRIQKSPSEATLQSYLGLLKHGDAFGARQELLNAYWIAQQRYEY